MKRPPQAWVNERKQPASGFALIIVLSLVAIISIFVLAYLSRSVLERQVSNSSTNGTRASLFAQGALESILGELKQEIVAGSTPTSVSTGSLTETFYTPLAPKNAVPFGVGENSDFPNVLKISSASPFFSGDSVKATNDATTNSSRNGRSVSLARWNQPLLLPKATATSTTDNTPVGSFTAPTWVLVARDGSNPTTFSTSTAPNVVGRYAYVIYDEGGLLDLNVAGHPSAATTAQAANRSCLAYADLTQIPGLTTTAIDSLVGWRNLASAQPSGSFPTYTFTSTSSQNFFQAMDENSVGFMTTANTSLAGGASDQKFASRQQLIDFFNRGLGASSNATLQNSLQYLGTFSRDLNQPSFTQNGPLMQDTDSQGNGNAGNDSTGHDTDFNPPFLSIRVATAFTRNDGTQAIVSEPLVKKRFALNRLAWLTYEGPSASRSLGDPDMMSLQNDGISQAFLQQGTAQNIQAYFGLTWNAAGYWTYNHGITGSNGQPIIGYLSKIRDASTPRDADFFELLKAGLKAGSLAKGATDPNGFIQEQNAFVFDTDLDYAVFQIGANIIAQSTTDGFPPRIQFNNGTITEEFRGVKNLPYLYRLRTGTVVSDIPNLSPPHPATSFPSGVAGTSQADEGPAPLYASPGLPPTAPLSDTGAYAVVFQPEVWNPHDVNCSLGNPRPALFRVVADGAPLDGMGNVLGSVNSNTSLTRSLQPLPSSAGNGGLVDLNSYPMTSGGPSTPPGQPSEIASMDLTKMNYVLNNFFVSNPTGISTQWTADNTEMRFTDNSGALFREPTLLAEAGLPAGSNLTLGPSNLIRTEYGNAATLGLYGMNIGTPTMGIRCLNDLSHYPASGQYPYVGFLYGNGPMAWVYTDGSGTSWTIFSTTASAVTQDESVSSASTYRVQYSPDNGTTWITYDEKYLGLIPYYNTTYQYAGSASNNTAAIGWGLSLTTADPRTRRFGGPGNAQAFQQAPFAYPYIAFSPPSPPPTAGTSFSGSYSFFTDPANHVLMSDRPNASAGFAWCSSFATAPLDTTCLPAVGGWFPNPTSNWLTKFTASTMFYAPGLLAQNSATTVNDGQVWQQGPATGEAQYFSDPDQVVRRAMAAYVPSAGGASASTTVGLPMAVTTGSYAAANQSQSRPIVLNRPFRSVAELGYVFSGTPWRNVDMFTPESGAAALTDVFCIQPDDSPSPLVAGKVDLNTRQEPVLQALLTGAYADELTAGGNTQSPISSSEAQAIANALITRTTDMTTTGKGPLTNISELVGKYVSSVAASEGGIDGSKSYDGFSADLSTLYGSSGSFSNPIKNNIERFREAALRPLADMGTTRVWNLMIDLVAQTGRYPQSATQLSDFAVDGETRYWLHVAIDRETGEVLDQNLEMVRE